MEPVTNQWKSFLIALSEAIILLLIGLGNQLF